MSTATAGRNPPTAPQPEVAPARRGIGARLRPPFSRGSSVPGDPSAGPGGPTDRYSGPRRWPWILALVLVGALLAGAVYGVFFSPLLGVTSVSISGAPDSVSVKVRAVVDVPDGTPLSRVDLDGVAERVNAVPEVAEVEVARNWPDTLVVTVTPRVPIAVTSANGRFWLMDTTGDPYLAVDAPPAGLVPVKLATPGAGDPATAAALTVVAALTPDFRAQVADLAARTSYDIKLTLTDGRSVIWGEATDSAKKMEVIPAVLAQQGTVYNISDPTLASVH
ncbi:MAG TPA: FtsQ-type POTRA domain-containing protein [Nakamurella sp.]|nr:FtsQ-type POTRA domain-containing protein [Nakamurella sp.]